MYNLGDTVKLVEDLQLHDSDAPAKNSVGVVVEDLAGLSVQWHGGQQVGNWWPYIEYACIYMSPNGHMSFGPSRSN